MGKNRILDYFASGTAGNNPPSAEEMSEVAREQLGQWQDRVERLVTERPGLAFGAAVSFGVLVGWLIKRRT